MHWCQVTLPLMNERPKREPKANVRLSDQIDESAKRSTPSGGAPTPYRHGAKKKAKKKEAFVQPVYEVDTILSSKVDNGVTVYHTLWKNYTRADATWEPASSFKSAPQVLAAFIKLTRAPTSRQRSKPPGPKTSAARTQPTAAKKQTVKKAAVGRKAPAKVTGAFSDDEQDGDGDDASEEDELLYADSSADEHDVDNSLAGGVHEDNSFGYTDDLSAQEAFPSRTGFGKKGCGKKKHTSLLSDTIGITDMNWGITSFMYPVLEAYVTLSARCQHTKQPISHRVAGQVYNMYDRLTNGFVGEGSEGPEYPEIYQDFRGVMLKQNKKNQNKKIVKACDSKAKSLSQDLVEEFKRRLEDRGDGGLSVMDLLLACELADPTTTREIDVKTWEAVEAICERYGLDYDAVWAEIKEARKICRGQYGDTLDAADTLMCKANLLNFYAELFGLEWNPAVDGPSGPGATARERLRRLGNLAMFAKAVFSVPIASAVVESLFSRYAYLKNKHRSSLDDDTVKNILLVQQLRELIGDPSEGFDVQDMFTIESDALADRLDY